MKGGGILSRNYPDMINELTLGFLQIPGSEIFECYPPPVMGRGGIAFSFKKNMPPVPGGGGSPEVAFFGPGVALPPH